MEEALEAMLRLRAEADASGVPVIYVNDNFDRWRSDSTELIERCLQDDCPARELVQRIRPRAWDYFLIKPQVSSFYATNLPVLLPRIGVSRLVLTDAATGI